jgi:hypothetical protein
LWWRDSAGFDLVDQNAVVDEIHIVVFLFHTQLNRMLAGFEEVLNAIA